MHWTSDLYAKVDQGDPGIVHLLAPDVRVTVGNHAKTTGIQAMMEGELGRHRHAAPTCTHQFNNIWDLGPNRAALDATVTYNRVDGRSITIPVLTIVGRNEAQLIDEMRLFIDNSPLFYGLDL